MVEESWLHQQIVEQLPLATMVWRAESDDPWDLRLVYVGPRSATETGFDLAPFLGQRIAEVLPAVIGRGSHHRIFNVATGNLLNHRLIYRYGDDRIPESWFRVDIQHMGQRCALMSFINITQQQQISLRPPEHPAEPRAEKALTEIEAVIGPVVGDVERWLYDRIVESIPLAVTVWWAETDDPRDLRMIYCGPHSTAITGTDMTRFVGLRLSESFPGVYETDLPYRIFAVATGGQADYIEAYPYGDENVPEGWFRIEARPIGQRCVLATYTNITEQQQAMEVLQQQEREAAVLAEISRIVSASLDLQDVYKELAASLHQLIPYEWVSIATTNLEQNTITLVYNTHEPIDPRWAIGRANPLPATVVAGVVRSRRPLLMQAETDAALLAQFPGARVSLQLGIRSTIAVPLVARDAAVGILLLRSGQANAFTQYHLNLAQQVAVQIAGSIANAWAYTALKGAEGVEAVLAQIGRIIGSTLNVDEVYDEFADCVRQLIPYDHMAIGTVDLEQDTITNVYNIGRELTANWAIGRPNPLPGVATESVVRTRQAQLIQAETDDALLAQFPGARAGLQRGMRSTLSVPLIARDEVIGVLTLRTEQANAYTPRHLDLAEQVALEIAGAIANAWAYATLKEAETTEAVLAEIGRIVNSTLDIEEVYATLTASVKQLIPHERLAIATVDMERDTVTVVYNTHEPVDSRWTIGRENPLPDMSNISVVQSRQPILMQAATEEALLARFPGAQEWLAHDIRSTMVVPLSARGELVGVLVLRSEQENAYTPRHLALAEQVAAQIAGAIANAWTYATLKETQATEAVLAEIGRIVSSTLDIEAVYGQFEDRVRQLVPCDRLIIATVDLAQDTITSVYSTDEPIIPRWAIGKANALRGLAAEQVARTRVPLLMQAATDADLVQRFVGAREALDFGFRSTIVTPLIARDEVVGVLIVRSTQANAYTPRHLHLAEQVGMHAAGAIANALAYATLRETQAAEAVLLEISRIISSTLEIQEVYKPLAASVRRLIPYDRLAIATVDLERDTITSVYNTATPINPRWAIGHPTPLRDTATESVVRTRRPLLMQAPTDEALLAEFPRAREGLEHGQLRSTMVAPLIARDGVVGVLTLRSEQANAYAPRHLDLAEQVGTQIAGAIANAWAYAALREKEAAEAALLRSNTQLEQFAYAAAHDLQEPLRVVGSYVQRLARRYTGQFDVRADRYINRSTAAVDRMKTLIDDLLAYSRVGTHDPDLTPTPTDEVVAEVLERLAVTIRETDAEITWDPLPTVQADASQVGQLFQNLLGNALKYRSAEAPRVHIGVAQQGRWWQFAVRDNGIGIEPQYAQRIFEVFQRLHTREEIPGTGIGLALCQQIVERHGGQLTVESQLGQGATFYFTLPAVGPGAT